jgi:3-hydroxymyristoyl/3-hydroxydecanoyl-(acyl carrier protein) dehydratase
MAQTGGCLVLQDMADRQNKLIYFMAIDKVKFRRPVVPGDALILEVVPLRKGGSVWKMRGVARVGDAIAAEAEFIAAIKNLAAQA